MMSFCGHFVVLMTHCKNSLCTNHLSDLTLAFEVSFLSHSFQVTHQCFLKVRAMITCLVIKAIYINLTKLIKIDTNFILAVLTLRIKLSKCM